MCVACKLGKQMTTVMLEPNLHEKLRQRKYGRLAFALGDDLYIDVTANVGKDFEKQVSNLARRLSVKLPFSAELLTSKE